MNAADSSFSPCGRHRPAGPWHHGHEIESASHLGAILFGSETGTYFMQHILAPFLAHYLESDTPANPLAPVTAFRTGSNQWERLTAWPQGCASRRRIEAILPVTAGETS